MKEWEFGPHKMYCQEIIEANIKLQTPQIILNEGTTFEKRLPFELKEYSIQECQEAIDYLNDKIDFDIYIHSIRNDPSSPKIEFKQNKTLSIEDLIFIENEKIMCKLSCNYWQDRYYKISNIRNKFIQFSPNAPQRVNRKIRARAQKLIIAIIKLVLKARQLGETTDDVGVELHRLMFYADVKGLVASKDKDSTIKLSRIFTDALERLPWWNKPHIASYDKKQFYIFENNSLLDLGWGTQDSLGRGTTPTVAHLSEIALFQYPVEAIEEALINAMHENEWYLLTLEGTAEGRDDWFHKIWKDTVEEYKAGATTVVPRFYPWCLRDDIKPTPEWIRGRATAFENFIPSTETLAHARKIESYVRNDADLRAELPNYKLRKEQLFWYEVSKKSAEKKGQLRSFLKEQPGDPNEAFQFAGNTIYSVQTILSLNDYARKQDPEVYMLVGDPSEIDPQFWPTAEQIKPNGKKIEITANWTEAAPATFYELIEVEFEGWDKFDPVNKILIWEHPIQGVKYGLSVDTSDGLGRKISDDAVICLLKKGTIEYKDKQVCEFASPELSQSIIGPFVSAIASYYSFEETPLMAISIDEGTELLNWLINRGYYNHHEMYDRTKIGVEDRKIKKIGFETNRQTRPDLINHINSFVKNNWIELHSVPLIEELQDIEKKTTISPILGKKKDKISGKNDNRFMALGMNLYALHIDEFSGLVQQAWKQRSENERNNQSFKNFGQYEFESNSFDYGMGSWEHDFDIEELNEEVM